VIDAPRNKWPSPTDCLLLRMVVDLVGALII
jgi:hypothetical protein